MNGEYKVPAAPVARHIHALLDAGMTRHAIANAAGAPVRVIGAVAAGRQQRVFHTTAQKLFTIGRPVWQETGQVVPSVGARRRAEALVALGWPLEQLEERTGLDGQLDILLFRGDAHVSKTIHEAVCGFYDALSMTPGPSRDTRRWARRAGYAPPLAWDEDTIDDPTAEPNLTGEPDDTVDEAAIWRRMNGDRVRLTRTEAAEAITRLRRAGKSDAEICRITGLKVELYVPQRRDLQGVAA